MAQVLEKYRATAGGSSTMYYYRYADNTSQATRIYTGEGIYLHKDYGVRETNGMYLMVDPSGWIHWYHVQDIAPVYVTVTDACTAPSAVTMDTASKVLYITGGSGGDLNNWTGFGVSHRDRAINSSTWGAWSGDTVVTSRSISVSVSSGMVRQYRVRTLGDAGSSYYSSYVVCETLLNGNTAAGTPAILLPLSGMETCAGKVAFRIECPPEPDGDNMTLQRSMDGGGWVTAAGLSGAGGVICDEVALSQGSHTVRYRLMDANGETGGEDSITFQLGGLAWQRTISTGDVIANRQISFVADIHEMLDRINQLRTFYGLQPTALPGTLGRVGDWQMQLSAMQAALDECRITTGRSAYGFEQAAGWPSARQINQLRTAIANT